MSEENVPYIGTKMPCAERIKESFHQPQKAHFNRIGQLAVPNWF